MSVSIATCPKCKSLLLSDTAQCPNCHHVLNPNRGINLAEAKLHSEVMGSSSDDIPCPDCGEMVRKELVRCWRCGGFLRPEMAESYERMRQNNVVPAAPVLREITTPLKVATEKSETTLPPLADDEDDFSLGPGITAIAPGAAPSAVATEATYGLTPALENTAAAELPNLPLEASTADAKESPATTSESTEDHSVATAGDVLLDIARQEEEESEGRKKQRTKKKPGGPSGARGGFLIFCPYGHQIEVQEKHRGQMGRCPRCKAQFIVPTIAFEEKAASESAPADASTAVTVPAEQPGALVAGKFTRWMKEVHVHPLDPTKLKLKPGSLESAFETTDFAFGLDGLLSITLVKKGSMFSSAEKKKPEVREAVVNHLAAGKPLSELQVAAQRLFGPETMKQIQVVQPALYAHESMFAGIPVFGSNRIAVRLPKPADANELLFASFWLSEFREFSRQLDEVFGIQAFGDDVGVPLTDKCADYKCHYTDSTFRALEKTDYHQADPHMKLVIVGRKCEGCGLVVSEEGRKKEKLGGVDGKGIAKAKCPKCQKKFGNIAFYAVETPVESNSPPPATTS